MNAFRGRDRRVLNLLKKAFAAAASRDARVDTNSRSVSNDLPIFPTEATELTAASNLVQNRIAALLEMEF